jgi:hypothetical protein
MKLLGGIFVFLAVLQPVWASDSPSNSPSDWSQSFDKGTREFSAGVGIFISPFLALSGRPTENFAGPDFQIGYMLSSPEHDESQWRGNFEIAGELFGAGIFRGKGNYVASTTLWLRYNLIPPKSKLVPYLQIGAGVTLTDADQSSFGQVFNFNEGVAFGVRYFVRPDCSLNGEYRMLHISNAGMADRNLGINAQGAMLSASWYF